MITQWMSGGPDAKKWAWEPAWLRDAVGEVAFHDVTQVIWIRTGAGGKLASVPLTDDQTAVLKSFLASAR